MRHRTLEPKPQRNTHAFATSSTREYSLRSSFQFKRPHARIEARRVDLEIPSVMAAKNSKSSLALAQNMHRILVVEDDKHTSRLNRSILEDEGYSVACAGSGEEALNMLKATTPSLVLLDVILPEMDGFDTYEKIREQSSVPIIFVSTEDRDEDMVRCLDMGADDYIAKPFSTTELATRVKAVLRRTSSNRLAAVVTRPATDEPDLASLDEADETEVSATEIRSKFKAGFEDPSFIDLESSNGSNGSSPDSSRNEQNYEGVVKLIVQTAGEIKNMLKFVGTLRENPQFHLLRVVSNPRRDGMNVSLRLRRPTPLASVLLSSSDVSKVETLEEFEIDPESGAKMSILKVFLD